MLIFQELETGPSWLQGRGWSGSINHRRLAHLSRPRPTIFHGWLSSALRTTMNFSDLFCFLSNGGGKRLSDGGSFRGCGPGSSRKTCSQAHCRWQQELGSLLVLKLLGITWKCFQSLEQKGFSEARVILNCSCPCPHLHGFVPGKLTSCMVKVQKELRKDNGLLTKADVYRACVHLHNQSSCWKCNCQDYLYKCCVWVCARVCVRALGAQQTSTDGDERQAQEHTQTPS